MSWLLVCTAATCACQTQPGEPAPQVVDSPVVSAVAVKETKAAKLVFIEHTGAYWTTGPALARVREYMMEHGLGGPMFVCYLDSKTRSPAGSVRSWIGFMLDGDHQVEPPFQAAVRPEELVAYMIIEGRPVSTRRDYAAIEDWIKAHAYMAAGSIFEIYEIAAPGEAVDRQRAEIQVVLDPSSVRSNPDRPSQPTKAVEVEPVPPGPPAQGERQAIERPDEAVVSLEASTKGAPAAQAVAGGATLPEPQSDEHPEATRTSVRSEVEAVSRPVEPVKHLMVSDQFDRIAEQLMPKDSTIPVGLQVWFGQIVFRLGAAAKGIQQAYRGREHRVGAVAAAISRRYKQVSVGFELDPLDQVVVHVILDGDPAVQRRNSIMHDLDTLLGRIAFRSIDAEAAIEEFTAIIQRVQNVMQEQTNKPAPRPGWQKGS